MEQFTKDVLKMGCFTAKVILWDVYHHKKNKKKKQ